MTQFAVAVPAVAEAAASARAVGAELRAELDRVRAEAEAVLTGSWLGRAADSFDRAWSRWHADARAVIAALDDLADALHQSAAAYADGDNGASDRLAMATR
jgi:WXG100 family type VII secretion target